MLKRMLLAIVITLKLFIQVGHAEVRDLDSLILDARTERLQRINEMTIHLNETLSELNKIQNELDQAVMKDKNGRGAKILIRNAATASAAIGIVATIIYQTRGVNPSTVILAGGYALSALAGYLAYAENRSIYLSRQEIEKLQMSIKDLAAKIEIEKRNLAREIRLLCLEQGGSPDSCDEV